MLEHARRPVEDVHRLAGTAEEFATDDDDVAVHSDGAAEQSTQAGLGIDVGLHHRAGGAIEAADGAIVARAEHIARDGREASPPRQPVAV